MLLDTPTEVRQPHPKETFVNALPRGNRTATRIDSSFKAALWIAWSLGFPVILDGDTGHGGIMAIRRMGEDCICRESPV